MLTPRFFSTKFFFFSLLLYMIQDMCLSVKSLNRNFYAFDSLSCSLRNSTGRVMELRNCHKAIPHEWVTKVCSKILQRLEP